MLKKPLILASVLTAFTTSVNALEITCCEAPDDAQIYQLETSRDGAHLVDMRVGCWVFEMQDHDAILNDHLKSVRGVFERRYGASIPADQDARLQNVMDKGLKAFADRCVPHSS